MLRHKLSTLWAVSSKRYGCLLKAAGGILLGVILVWLALPFTLRWIPFDADQLFTGDVSTTVYDRKGRLLRAYLARDDQWRIAVPLKEISPWVIRATLAAEDRRFFQHSGVDWRALARAAWQNLRSGRVVSGASTISMQVVGLADSRERSIWRKLRQIVRALQLERCRTKEEILELYLTNAPYGGNIRGVEAAAWRYFGKSSRELTAAESALLAGIPQAPSRLRPDRFPHAARRRALAVLTRMHEFGYLNADDFQRAIRHLPEIRAASPPVLAPHFCDFVRERFPGEPRIHTTLDLDLQRTLEQMVDEQLRCFSSQGITNAAAVVLDNATGDVLAMVGSADYWNTAIAGQVNGAMAPRSPGSTLKPFIYALALQRGAICPTTMLADVPGLFTNYDPKNFDRQWRGLVPVERALAWSLNVPAMQVLERVGTSGLLELLDAAGVRRTMPRHGEVGLTLAVGTCSVRLLELTNAYAMLARGGIWQPYRVAYPPSPDESRLIESARRWNLRMTRERQMKAADWQTSASVRLLNEDACYYINLILSDDGLRDPSDCLPELRGFRGVAWKTGTSNGYHDAWTIAYDLNWTVGVWFGNFDGKPSAALIGGAVAAPVALRVMNTLRQNSPNRSKAADWPSPPTQPEPVTICGESGDLATETCPTTRTVLFTQGCARASQANRCNVHHRMLVDALTGAAICARCMGGRPLKGIVVADWPPAVASWLRQQGKTLLMPPHFAGCPSIRHGRPPHIISPHDGETFLVTPLRDRTYQRILFSAVADDAVQTLYWFVDEELVAALPPTSPYYWLPVVGEHVLRCVDDRGFGASVTFVVVDDSAESLP